MIIENVNIRGSWVNTIYKLYSLCNSSRNYSKVKLKKSFWNCYYFKDIHILFIFITCKETCLVVQWLRLCTVTEGGVGSIPGWETKIPYATEFGKKKKKKWKYYPFKNIKFKNKISTALWHYASESGKAMHFSTFLILYYFNALFLFP